jgi:hypothetical protein
MNSKKLIATSIGIAVCLVLCFSTGLLEAGTLGVSTVYQEHSQWCWIATSKCLIIYKAGSYPSQCSCANVGLGYSTCCNTSGSFDSHPCNYPGTGSQMQSVLNNWGVSNSSTGLISFASVVYLIDGNRPFIIGRSGHATVGYGYSGSNYLYVMDPWPGRGKSAYSYSYYASGWFLTIYTY